VYFVQSRAVPKTPAPTSPLQTFGRRVRALRGERGLTQEDLAERCGVFRTYMSRIETGQANPTLLVIHALAVAWRCRSCSCLSAMSLLSIRRQRPGK